jgi:hypothetical protein
MALAKMDTLVLQVGGWANNSTTGKKSMFRKPQSALDGIDK